MNYWFKSSFFILSSRFIRTSSNVLIFYMLVRIFDVSNFGVWILFLTINNLLEPFFRGIINNAGIKYIAPNRERPHLRLKIQSSLLEIIAISFIITSILTLLGGQFLSEILNAKNLGKMLNINLIFLLFLVLRLLLESLGQAFLDFKGITLSVLVNRLLFLILIGSVFFSNYPLNLIEIVYIRIINSVITLLVTYWIYHKYLSRGFTHNLYWLKKILNYAKFNIASDFSSILFKNTDKLMLGNLTNTLGVALYDAAIRVANFAEIPILTLASATFPKMAQTIKLKGIEKGIKLYEKTVGFLLSITIPLTIVVIIFSKWIIIFIAGEEYIGSISILNITMLYSLMIPFNRFYGVFMNSLGKPSHNLYNTLIILFVNVISNYFFIMKYGPIGAAYGTLLGYLIGVITGQILLNKFIKVDYKSLFMNIFKSYPDLFKNTKSLLMKRNNENGVK